MKIAVISDIHGNMEAVEAVMQDIEAKNCDKIFILGDYAMAGPEPQSTVEYFMNKKSDSRFTMIQGNTDLMIADYNDELYRTLKEKAPVMAEALKSDAQLLNPVEKEFLKNLPIQKEVKAGGVKFLLVHGSPRKNNEDILPDTPLSEVEKCLKMLTLMLFYAGIRIFHAGFRLNRGKQL